MPSLRANRDSIYSSVETVKRLSTDATAPLPTLVPEAGVGTALLSGTALLGGYATFYDVASGHAAAGPDLRAALGGDPAFRGKYVRVCAGSRCLTTRLTDWCACRDRNGRPTLVDLARSDFARLGPTSRGVLLVTIEIAAGPQPTLPNTDTAEEPEHE